MVEIFYKCRNGSLYKKATKAEIMSIIDPYDHTTFEHYLKEMDYPFIKNEYKRIISYMEKKKLDMIFFFGKYIATMRLASYKDYGFKDSIFLNERENKYNEKYK